MTIADALTTTSCCEVRLEGFGVYAVIILTVLNVEACIGPRQIMQRGIRKTDLNGASPHSPKPAPNSTLSARKWNVPIP